MLHRAIITGRALELDRPIVARSCLTHLDRNVEPRRVYPPFVGDLLPYQREGVAWLCEEEHARALLCDEMGLGKTVQALRALSGPAIVVCPASLRLVWREQIRQWAPKLRVRLAKARELPIPKRGEVVVASLDALPDPSIIAAGALRYVTLVIDEAQRAMSDEAARSERVELIARACGRVIALTGTPMPGTPADLLRLLEVVGVLERSFGSRDAFVNAFGGERGRFGIDWPDEPEDLPTIREALDRVMLRRLRADVAPELPAKRYETIPVEVPDTLLDELRAADRAWKKLGTNALPPFDMLAEVRSALARSRIRRVLEYVDEREKLEPLVVTSAHVEPILAFEGRPGWGVIVGATPTRVRQSLVRAFQAGELRGLAVTIGAGGVGFTLTRAAHLVRVSRSYTPADNDQVEDRLARLGQTARSILITDFVSDHPVERRLLDILEIKRKRARLALDGVPKTVARRRPRRGARLESPRPSPRTARARDASARASSP